MVATDKRGKKLEPETSAALQKLRSVDFFAMLRGALRNLGLTGKDELMGLGAYFVAVSRLQEHPLRVQVRERTDGTAVYVARKVGTLFPPDSLVAITPTDDEGWARLAGSPDNKVVLISEWEANTKARAAEVEVSRDQIIRRLQAKGEERYEERVETIKGKFAFISVARPFTPGRHPRWLTMKQAEGQQKPLGTIPNLGVADVKNWCAVQRLLEERAKLPIVLPGWEQVVIEQMGERDERALRHVPTVLQAWRTMSLIRSFQSVANDKATELTATFEDLAALILLGKKVFSEACWFPSTRTVFGAVAKPGVRTSVISPATGKPVGYEVVEQQESTSWGPVIQLTEE